MTRAAHRSTHRPAPTRLQMPPRVLDFQPICARRVVSRETFGSRVARDAAFAERPTSTMSYRDETKSTPPPRSTTQSPHLVAPPPLNDHTAKARRSRLRQPSGAATSTATDPSTSLPKATTTTEPTPDRMLSSADGALPIESWRDDQIDSPRGLRPALAVRAHRSARCSRGVGTASTEMSRHRAKDEAPELNRIGLGCQSRRPGPGRPGVDTLGERRPERSPGDHRLRVPATTIACTFVAVGDPFRLPSRSPTSSADPAAPAVPPADVDAQP